MKTRSLHTSLALLGVALLLTPAAFAKDKKKDKNQEQQPPTNLDQWGVNRNPDSGREPAPVILYQAQPVKLRIENHTGQVVGIYYVSPRGTTENLGELPADGKKHDINAYAGQVWVFKIGRQVIQQYQATGDSKQSIALGGGGGGGGYYNGGGGGGGGYYPPPPAPYPVDPPVRRYRDGGNFAPEVGDRAAFLRVHNDARAQVRVAPLRWDPGCADAAQEWANTLARRDRGLAHSGSQDYGENVWGGSGHDFTPADAARAWASEGERYDGRPIDENNFGRVGHYTQMVWSRTTAVGYGIARGASGTTYIVANYAPPGNALGQRPFR